MNCPICESYILRDRPVRYLPRFFKCPDCSGYYQREKDAPRYEETYFSEKTKPTLLGRAVSAALGIFSALFLIKIKNLVSQKNARILDYGCGDGKRVRFLNENGFFAEGYDPSVSAAELAQKNNIPVYSSMPNQKYDLIMFWHSLEHSDKPFSDIQNCKKYLLAGAKLLIAVPNGNSFGARLAADRWFGYDWPYHRVHFTPKALKILLEKNGFKVLSIDHFNPEYTIAFTAQTFLNLLLPKNVFYTVVSNRRREFSGFKALTISILSIILLLLFSPTLLVFYIIELVFKKTGAIIIVAQNI